MGELEEKLKGILENPQEMEKIMALAQNLMGGKSPPSDSAPPSDGNKSPLEGILNGLDPGILQKVARGFTGGVGTAALLKSITPHLKDERQSQLNRAITIAQMVRVAKSVFSD